jgi:hypothetical protein
VVSLEKNIISPAKMYRQSMKVEVILQVYIIILTANWNYCRTSDVSGHPAQIPNGGDY